jgi:putative endopeptidase
MKKVVLPIIAIMLMTTAGFASKNVPLSAGIKLSNLDKTASPHVDFYQFACGGWMKNNPITGEYSRFGSFDKLAENNKKQLRGLIEELAKQNSPQGTVAQKIGTLYHLAMDSAKLNADGYAPIKADLEKIGSLKSVADILKFIPEMTITGADPYFSISVGADPMNSSMNLIQTYQSGIGLGQRDYYLENDANTKNIRDKYKEHIVKMFRLVGFSVDQAKLNMDDIMRIETRLATVSYDKVKLRDPYANYNKMTIDELQKVVPEIEWKSFLAALGLPKTNDISLSQKEFMVEVGKILTSESVNAQIAYLQWKLIDSSASYLSDEIYAQNFEFYGKILSGKKEQSPRWKRGVSTVDGILGEAVGQMYVQK